MSTEASAAKAPRKLWRSIAAVLAGVMAVIICSLGTDAVLHWLGVYPAPEQPMTEPGLNLLALSYRCFYNVLAAYLVIALAPGNSLRLLWIFTGIGFVLGGIGAVVTIPMHLGPAWYPILLAVSPFPCSWIAWKLRRSRSGAGT